MDIFYVEMAEEGKMIVWSLTVNDIFFWITSSSRQSWLKAQAELFPLSILGLLSSKCAWIKRVVNIIPVEKAPVKSA